MAARSTNRSHKALRISVDNDTEFLLLDERLAKALGDYDLFPEFCGGVCEAIEAAHLQRQKGGIDLDGDVVLDLKFDWEAPPEIPLNYAFTLRANNSCIVSPYPTVEGHLSCPLG